MQQQQRKRVWVCADQLDSALARFARQSLAPRVVGWDEARGMYAIEVSERA